MAEGTTMPYRRALETLVYDSFELFTAHYPRVRESGAEFDAKTLLAEERALVMEQADLEARIDMARGVYGVPEDDVMADLWQIGREREAKR